MSKKNGFTLIEVIVSITLLGIISLGFLSALNNNINFLKINKDMTANAFAEQKEMELKILQTKADIKSGTIPATSLTTINNVFENGINVNAYKLKYTHNNQDLYTLVTDTRLPEFKVPIAKNVKAQLRDNTTNVNFAYAVSSTNVVGSSTIDPSTNDVFMVNNYNWYVSRPGFNIPMPNTLIPEIEVGNKYPKFPEDYSLIPTSTTVNLNDVTAYAGRHIVFAVTPAAKSGKMGQMVPSNPVFISGLPPVNVSDLFLHLDASVISNTDTSQVTASGSDLLVQKWNDLSTNKKNATQGSETFKPKLKEHPVGGDFVGKFVDFDTSKSVTVNHNPISGVTLNVFAVVRGNDSAVFYTNGVKSIQASGDPIGSPAGPWKIVTATYTSSDSNFTLGNSDVDVAELIIYKGALTEANKNAVIKYLKEKYVPLATMGKIVQLRPLTDVEVIKNEPYTLPFAVLAEMEYGSDRYVPVTWDKPVNVNTSTIGTQAFTATAVNDTTKKANLNVIVKDRVYVSSVSLNVNNYTLQVGKTFDLIATILPANATNKAITWESSNPSVATVSSNGFDSAEVKALVAGTTVITVKTADGNKIATCNVTVKNPANIINIVSTKYLADISATSDTSYAVVIRFSDPINLKSDFNLQDFKSTSDLLSNSSNITKVEKSTSDSNSIIVSFSNNIYGTFSGYPGTKDNNKISNDSFRATDGNEVNIANGNSFTIKDEILKYNSSNKYRILIDGLALDVSGQGTSESTEIIIWTNKNNTDPNQLWYLTSTSDFAHTIHWKPADVANRYLRVVTSDEFVYQNSSNTGNEFKWIIERYRNASGDIDYYTIRPLNYQNKFFGVESKTSNSRIKRVDNSKYYKWDIKYVP